VVELDDVGDGAQRDQVEQGGELGFAASAGAAENQSRWRNSARSASIT
jgi:hypothetical protein